ncbi:hypothetical protein [Paenibacillus sp. J2TS4]|uniref:hypothetical protein n=1 Tax=Paenibacillus sp. J2TS4 TaxID=2807194 RepID=UPI001B16B06B|nr:hypothetical protein [Paenibacillus sp. J2TS4]GIP32672.1 hypothetical protein J2TS4_18820 [Paenibacillus sp. J2TS4]
MKIGLHLLILLVLVISVGCGKSAGSFEADTFSDKDMCIRKKEDLNAVICYGMSRAKAEEVAGSETGSNMGIADYPDGVRIFYRDDTVAGMALFEGSQGIYQTARGAELGMLLDDIKKLYGEKYKLDTGERNLDYAYDTATQKFLSTAEAGMKTQGESQSIYLFSGLFKGEDHTAESLFLVDRKMAIFMN